ncbi:MAG: hypothetical protein IPG07_15635 [Crocinitomicaceae bacterium]|nr:hypothetical protein [Crocinitomicaceae bacterium]
MVQTIVENSIKHGISKSIGGGEIIIHATYKNSELLLTVENTGKIDATDSENGVGVANTKKRLAILFADNAEFKLFQDGNFVKASFKIKYV